VNTLENLYYLAEDMILQICFSQTKNKNENVINVSKQLFYNGICVINADTLGLYVMHS